MRELVRAPERRSLFNMFDDFDTFFDDFWRPSRTLAENGRAAVPAVDVIETDREYVIKAELPGVKKDDLNVSIQDGVLTINAETKYEHEENKDGRLIRQERRYGKFVRSMRLGDDVDAGMVKAEYKDGVLDLRVPKREEATPRTIDIKVS